MIHHRHLLSYMLVFMLTDVGLLRVLKVRQGAIGNLIPCDIVANLCLTAAQWCATDREEGSQCELKVYNCTADAADPLSAAPGFQLLSQFSREAPPSSRALRKSRY